MHTEYASALPTPLPLHRGRFPPSHLPDLNVFYLGRNSLMLPPNTGCTRRMGELREAESGGGNTEPTLLNSVWEMAEIH